MRRVPSQDTSPELLVRSLTHRLGYRFRLYRKDLPGNPDLTFPRLKSVIFVHGCFWHDHNCPKGSNKPKSNREYWLKKISGNVKRDRLAIRRLRKDGWRVLVVWECQTRAPERLLNLLKKFLSY